MGSNCACHQLCRFARPVGGTAARRSIFSRSQPAGKNPSIIEPARVVIKFMVLVLWAEKRGRDPLHSGVLSPFLRPERGRDPLHSGVPSPFLRLVNPAVNRILP